MQTRRVPELHDITPRHAMAHGARSGIMGGLLVGAIGGTTYFPILGTILGALAGGLIGALFGVLGAPVVLRAARSGHSPVRHGRIATALLSLILLAIVALVAIVTLGGSGFFWAMFVLYAVLLLLLGFWFVPHFFGSLADPHRKPTFTGEAALRLPVLAICLISLVPGIVLWTLVLTGH